MVLYLLHAVSYLKMCFAKLTWLTVSTGSVLAMVMDYSPLVVQRTRLLNLHIG